MAILISYPASLCFSANVAPLVVSTNVATSFVLKRNGLEILNEVYYPDNTGKFTVELKEIVDSTLSVGIPSGNIFTQVNAVATFTIHINNVLVHTFKAVKSGIEGTAPSATTFFKGNFMTWQPQVLKVKYQDIQYLTYFANETVNVKLKFYYQLNNVATSQIVNYGVLYSGNCYSLNMKYAYLRSFCQPATIKPTHIEVWTENLAGVKQSYVQRYQLTDNYDRFDDVFLFENSLGGVDAIRFDGWLEGRDEHKISTAVFNDVTKEYDLEYNRIYNKNTGYIATESYRKWALDFFTSINRYHIVNGIPKRIILPKFDTKNTMGELNDFSFDFYYSEEVKYEQYSRLAELPAVETEDMVTAPDWVSTNIVVTTGGAITKFNNTVVSFITI